MIYVGLTGWGDHSLLYQDGTLKKNKLKVYSSHFPVVEIDSSFYAIQPVKNYRKWIEETPPNFSFIVKAYQGMTGHARGEVPYSNITEMYTSFRESIQPLIQSKKLKAILFQFPPWFTCKKENVELLRYIRDKMKDLPLALEFRNQTWFTASMRDKTLHFMQSEGWIHSICDEPQAGIGSVPTVLHPTHKDMTLVRFHGRNTHGWTNKGQSNWRDVRYLYRYNKSELLQWKNHLLKLQKQTKEIVVLFNNNSGGDAAPNALEMIQLLEIEYQGLAPKQLKLF